MEYKHWETPQWNISFEFWCPPIFPMFIGPGTLSPGILRTRWENRQECDSLRCDILVTKHTRNSEESGNSQCSISSGSLQALLFRLDDAPGQQVVFGACFCHCLTPAHLWGSSSRFLELQCWSCWVVLWLSASSLADMLTLTRTRGICEVWLCAALCPH